MKRVLALVSSATFLGACVHPHDTAPESGSWMSSAESISIVVRAVGPSRPVLAIAITNRSPEPLVVSRSGLPWTNAYSLLLTAVRADAVGTVLERSRPVDDPLVGTFTIVPGQTVSGGDRPRAALPDPRRGASPGRGSAVLELASTARRRSAGTVDRGLAAVEPDVVLGTTGSAGLHRSLVSVGTEHDRRVAAPIARWNGLPSEKEAAARHAVSHESRTDPFVGVQSCFASCRRVMIDAPGLRATRGVYAARTWSVPVDRRTASSAIAKQL